MRALGIAYYVVLIAIIALIFFASRPVFAVVLSAGFLLNWRLIKTMQLKRPVTAVLCAMMILYTLTFIAYQEIRTEDWLWFYPLTLIAASAIGFLAYACVFSLLKDLIFFICRCGKSIKAQRIGSAAIVGLTLIFGIMSVLHHHDPKVIAVDVELPEEARALEGLKIVQLSDLHMNVDTSEEGLKQLVRRVNELDPDIIVLTGDLVEMQLPDPTQKLRLLSGLKAPLGVYSVLGNHDYFRATSQDVLDYFKECQLYPLVNENVILSYKGADLLLGGVTDPVSRNYPDAVKPSMTQAAASDKPSVYQILLSHQPQAKLTQEAAEQGFDLQLSGHTHGGQFYPWTWVTEAMLTYNIGFYDVGGMKLYVNQGTSAWIPLRLGTDAEITLLNFTAPKKS